MPDLLAQRQVEVEIIAANKRPDFLWQRYFIASLYRVGYGILAIVTHIVR